MKCLITLLILLATALVSFAQNGKILEQQLISFPGAALRAVEPNVPNAKALAAATRLYRITYLSDGLKVKGYLALPQKDGKYPCVIYNRGGNREVGKLDEAGFLDRGLADLCEAGYVVIASQYRGNDGGEGKEEFGGKDVNDVLHLIPLLATVPQADTSRIGMMGWSRGGMMTYLALAKSNRIKAAVVGSGVTDLQKSAEERADMNTVFSELIPGYATNGEAVLKERSVMHFAEKINRNTPVLILAGTADWRVAPTQALSLADRFYELKQPYRLVLYEGGQHSLSEHRQDYVNQMLYWFNTYLRDGKKWPTLEPHGR